MPNRENAAEDAGRTQHEIRPPQRRQVGMPAPSARRAVRGEAAPEQLGERLLSFLPPEGLPGQPAAVIAAGPAVGEDEDGPAVAVVVTHGMGQQIQFQTLDQVEQGLRRIEEEQTGVPVEQQPRAVARAVLFGDQIFQRLEMRLTGDPGRTVQVHLYEAYWAPLTEGRVTLRDVMGFLTTGALNGLRNSRGEFWRWMFNRRVELGRQRTAWKLLLALAVVAALVLFNAVISAVGAALLASRATAAWLSPALLADLSVVLIAVLAGLGLSAALAWATRQMLFLYLALGIVLLGGAALLWALAANRLGLATWQVEIGHRWTKLVFIGLWALLLAVSYLVRQFMIQYAGDVAVYVFPQKLDRFNKLRNAIKECVVKTVEAVYGALTVEGDGFQYQSVALVGHSLGSVVAYDALNGLLNKDSLSGGRLRIVPRTNLLLTFGSPLDKTAFLFGCQRNTTTESREALAAVVQPLIQSYDWRGFPWVNVYSPKDIISGEVRFYDDTASPEYPLRHVQNLQDPLASIPVAAHVQYWRTDRVWRVLHQSIVGQGAGARPEARTAAAVWAPRL